MDEITADLLNAFVERSQKKPGPIPYSVQFNFSKHDRHLFVCSATHGDEVGSIPAILKFIDDIESQKLAFGGKITIALGNVEAIRINKRFVVEDMNRAFAKKEPTTVDAKRAGELGECIRQADLFIDLHQTIGPTKSPFYVIRESAINNEVCEALGMARLAISVNDEELKNEDRVTGTAFAFKNNVPALTLELSQKGYNPNAEALAYKCISKAVHLLDQSPVKDWKKTIERTAVDFLKIDYAYDFTHPKMRLVEGLINGEHYKKGHLLGYNGDEKIFAPYDGYIFFPKYPERNQNGEAKAPLPSHLFEFGRVIS